MEIYRSRWKLVEDDGCKNKWMKVGRRWNGIICKSMEVYGSVWTLMEAFASNWTFLEDEN